MLLFFFFKQNTAYEMRISDWSSDVCSSDLVGAQVLPDQVCLNTDAGAILLSHGDEYCTADRNYQRFRRIVRCPAVQWLFLKLSLRARRGIADLARKRSMASNRDKPVSIMDVSPSAIERAFSSVDADIMIHGHTHRPAMHRLMVGGRMRSRHVLPDWDYDHAGSARGGWLVINADGISHEDSHPQQARQTAPDQAS